VFTAKIISFFFAIDVVFDLMICGDNPPRGNKDVQCYVIFAGGHIFIDELARESDPSEGGKLVPFFLDFH
jgi:hypothetical protein